MPYTDKDIVEIALKEKTHDEVVISLLANKIVSVNTLAKQGISCVYKLIINATIREISNKRLQNLQDTAYESFL